MGEHRLKIRLLLVAGMVSITVAPAADIDHTPPATRTVDVVDHPFGMSLPDPYRWMEGDKNPEFQQWLEAQGAFTRSELDRAAGLNLWRQRLRDASNNSLINRDFTSLGSTLFYLRQSGAGTGTLFIKKANHLERILLDPSTLKTAKSTATISTYAPSPDGKRVAINLAFGGDEISRIQIMDVATGAWLTDTVDDVWGEFGAQWLPDGAGFTYTQMAPLAERSVADRMLNMRVKIHHLGLPAEDDRILLRADSEIGANQQLLLQSNEFPRIKFDSGSRWAVATATGAHPERRLCVAPIVQPLSKSASWTCGITSSDAVQGYALHQDTIYLLSAKDHPNGRIVALPLNRMPLALSTAHEIVPMSNDIVITGLVAARDALYIKQMRNGIDQVVRVDYQTNVAHEIAMPFAGSARSFTSDSARDGVLFSLQGWTVATRTFQYDPRTRHIQDLGLNDFSPGDYSDLVSEETDATSADGTQVPLSIIHRKDVRLDGRNPALVRAYGGYGISAQPLFYPIRLEWVKAGGVLAIAHVRGGGEKGDAWHRAGQRINKIKGVEDFLACAAHLEKMGYTDASRTALESRSMGGLLIGGAITHAPGSFGAAIVAVGILNPVRLLEGNNGANQIAEVGDPRVVDDMKAIVAIDPYQNIRPGVAYPAVLLMVGLNDSRVSTWETGKFAAKLRAATSGQKAVWIRAQADMGHIADSLASAADAYADAFAFLDMQLPHR